MNELSRSADSASQDHASRMAHRLARIGLVWIATLVVLWALPAVAQEKSSFMPPTNYPTGGRIPLSIATGIFANGGPGLAVVNSGSNTLSIFTNKGTTGGVFGGFSPPVILSTGANPVAVLPGIFHNNGINDLVTVNFDDNNIAIFPGRSDGTFGTATFFGTGGFDPSAACTGDFNRDGNLDLAVANHFEGTVGILFGNGQGGFIPGAIYSVGAGPGSIACGRLNGDVFQDFVTGNTLSNNLTVFHGNGDGTFGNPQTLPTGSSPIGVFIQDINRDGVPDVMSLNQGSGTITTFFGSPTGFLPPQNVSIGGGVTATGMTWGDINGDGTSDILVATSNGVTVLENDGTGTFGAPVNLPIQGLVGGTVPIGLAVGDFNGDGRLDVVVPNYTNNTVGLLLNNSTGTVVPQTGWYYDPALNGSGIFIESGGISGSGVFMADFLYDSSGNPSWVVANGPMAGSTLFNGTWLKVTGGQTLTGPYQAPTGNTSMGNTSLFFPDSSHAVMTRPTGAPINLQRFSFTSSVTPAAPEAGAPQNGWWWGGSALSGTGYGIEIQGSNVFIVAYVYDGNGNPVWDLATGTLTSPTQYTGTWDTYTGGPQFGSPEGKFSATKSATGSTPMTLVFSNVTHAILTMGNTVISLVRFQNF